MKWQASLAEERIGKWGGLKDLKINDNGENHQTN